MSKLLARTNPPFPAHDPGVLWHLAQAAANRVHARLVCDKKALVLTFLRMRRELELASRAHSRRGEHKRETYCFRCHGHHANWYQGTSKLAPNLREIKVWGHRRRGTFGLLWAHPSCLDRAPPAPFSRAQVVPRGFASGRDLALVSAWLVGGIVVLGRRPACARARFGVAIIGQSLPAARSGAGGGLEPAPLPLLAQLGRDLQPRLMSQPALLSSG